MRFKFVNVPKAFPELGGLFAGYGSVNGGLNLRDRMLATPVNEGRDIERLAGVFQNVADDGT